MIETGDVDFLKNDLLMISLKPAIATCFKCCLRVRPQCFS